MPIIRFVPQQKRMSTTMGGLLILVSETMFLFSMLNFLLVTRIQYYNPGDPYMRQLFPHYLVFLAALTSAALVAKGPRVRLHPAKQNGVLPAAGCETTAAQPITCSWRCTGN